MTTNREAICLQCEIFWSGDCCGAVYTRVSITCYSRYLRGTIWLKPRFCFAPSFTLLVMRLDDNLDSNEISAIKIESLKNNENIL